MKIAFVGKGGSGKTTVSSLFSLFAQQSASVVAIDADVNIHMKDMLGFKDFPISQYLSAQGAYESLQSYVYNDSPLIEGASSVRKTTPPSEYSRYIDLSNLGSCPLGDFFVSHDSLSMAVVGTYVSDAIGKSCYHSHLASLEILLSHMIHHNHTVVVDMVAGVDAFASSLHAQFDIFVLVVEPTLRSVGVYTQFIELAEAAGVADYLYVVVNKAHDLEDIDFVSQHIPSERILGGVYVDSHVRNVDRGICSLSVSELDSRSQDTLKAISDALTENAQGYNTHLARMFHAHREYVSQSFINDPAAPAHIQDGFNLEAFVSQNFS